MSTIPMLSRVRQLITTLEPPELGPGPRPGVQPLAALQKHFDATLNDSDLPRRALELIRATILLWHDHLDVAHTIAQELETSDGSYVHGIMHRREPDYGNAKYWFRRVGKHPCFPSLATHSRTLLQSDHEHFGEKMISRGDWDPFAFVDACEQVAELAPADPRVKLLRAIQQAEFEILLEHFCSVR